MLIHGFNSHYRDLQKKLFLGETVRLFANPGQMGAGPDQQTQQAETQAEANGESAFYREMKSWVPSNVDYNSGQYRETVDPGLSSYNDDPGEHMDVMDEWLSQMGSVNMIQIEINKFIQIKKDFYNPKFLQDRPLLKAKILEAYKKMLSSRQKLEELRGMNMAQDIDWGNLKRKTYDDYQVSTREVINDANHVIQKLVDKRIAAMRVIRETMIQDFNRRLVHFQQEWNNNPPSGYDSAAPHWIEAADQIMEEVEKLEEFDSRNPEFPEGDRMFEKARNLWEGIRNMETTLEIYRNGQDHGLTPTRLEQELADVERIRKSKITDEFVANNQAKVDQVLAKVDGVLAQLNGLEQTKELKEQIAEVEKLKVHLLEHRDLNGVIDKVLNDPTPVSEGKEHGGVTYSLPKGLKGQLDFIKKVPVSVTERNHMMYRFQDAIKALKNQIEGAEKTMETLYPDILKRVALVQEELDAQKQVSGGYKIYWLAPGPTFGIVSHAIQDVFQKNYDRDTKRKAGIWGSKAFKFLENLPTPIFEEQLRPLKEISGKMAIETEHAETSDYQEWMKNHESASVAHLIHVMHETTNQFEFRGVIELLAKKGRMRFDDEGFLKQLNRWQVSYPIPSSKYWHLANRARSEDLIKQAVNLLYGDIDLFHNWRSSNSSAIDSEKGKFNARFAEVSEVPGGLESEIKPILDEFMVDHHAGKHISDADPVKYESVLTYAINQGKMDAEDVLYYLIQGIGHGLLPLERGSVFTGLNNNYPAIELFASGTKRGAKPVLEDVQEWAQMSKDEYLDWFHSYVMYLPKVRQRLVKAQSQGMRLDHDYFTAFAGYLNSSTIKRLLQANNEGYGLQETAVQNGTVGMLFALDTLAESYDEFNDDTGQKALSNMVETILLFDGITSGKVYANQGNFFRMSSSTRDAPPRYSGAYKKYYGRGGMSTGDHLKTMKKQMHLLDFDSNFPMIRMLLNGEFRNDQQAAQFANKLNETYPGVFGENQMPTSVDKLYESIGVYIDYAIKNSKPSVRTFIKAMKDEHHANIEAMRAEQIRSGKSPKEAAKAVPDPHTRRHDRDHKMRHWRHAFKDKMEAGQLVEDHHGGHDEHHEEHGE